SSCDGTARVWDAGTGEQLLRLEQPDADPGLGLPVQDAAFSADGLLIASLVVPKFSVWNAKTGKRLVTLDHPPGNPTGLALTPDGKTLITF
ncbi:WD40 repeat domain-containing protein, partial [Klebsiella pneumoniae]|uniref:WD40 repeat domain-containing protein n=1 Tax=Klebsiella pneumoniae TaxID=573 RepID=UPI003853F20B